MSAHWSPSQHPPVAHASAGIFHWSSQKSTPFWLYTLYTDFSIVIDCTFVYPMCNSVLFLLHCFALAWPGHSCKWELVHNWPTWWNKIVPWGYFCTSHTIGCFPRVRAPARRSPALMTRHVTTIHWYALVQMFNTVLKPDVPVNWFCPPTPTAITTRRL